MPKKPATKKPPVVVEQAAKDSLSIAAKSVELAQATLKMADTTSIYDTTMMDSLVKHAVVQASDAITHLAEFIEIMVGS